jgi:thiamine-monophosphate kinase
MKLGPGREFDRIRRFLDSVGPAPGVAVGPGDDCAVLADGTVLSIDLSIEDVHFRRSWLTLEDIGYRAAAVSLSDLAACAADPVGMLVSLAISREENAGIGDAIMAGVKEAAALYGAPLLGGDLTRSPGPIIVDVAVVGRAQRPVLRSGARPGDAVWVTGRLGAAARAVRDYIAGTPPARDAARAFTRPAPRIAQARWLAERGVPTAMIDLSDGLAGDAAHIAAASDVRIVLRSRDVPLHDCARGALDLGLAGGDDYELCFTAPDEIVGRFLSAWRGAFGELYRVGAVVAGSGVAIEDEHGVLHAWEGAGFDHFAGTP